MLHIRSYFAFLLAFLPCHFLLAQTLPIAIDGLFSDWTTEAVSFEDGVDATNGNDLLRMSVANDENYLFIRFEVSDEVVLTDNNDLTLFIDGDHNSLTGKSTNGIGAELELRFGDRDVIFYHGNSQTFLDLSDVKFHSLPTFSGKVFELAIGRNVKPDGIFPLFTGNQIRLFFQNGTAGDKMPNAGLVFNFTFDNDPAPPYQPIDLQKLSPNHLRLMTWNVLQDGLLDIVRKSHFQRVLATIQPDIVTFNECWDMTAAQAKSFMNTALPLANGQSWNTVKLESGNITATRYPILQNWNIYPGHRLMASLIDLPDAIFDKDILVVNGHLRCCSANSERQLEADAFASFILDAKSPGGVITLPENTPFVLSGDMNLVGWEQQYLTLSSGDIVNTSVFGNGGPLDWNNSPLVDVVALQTDQRMAYTWNEPGSQYPPSRLDFHFCSNSVLEVKKAFTLQTEIMSQARLDAFGLYANDTGGASDHLPKVTDFVVREFTGAMVVQWPAIQLAVSPNPATTFTTVKWTNPKPAVIIFSLKKMDGILVRQWTARHSEGPATEFVDLVGLSQGAYLLEMQVAGEGARVVLVKLE
ncbi:MAG: endonuclease/exonuclease/phosphatase family protein [Saprospiraceae bacterium]|nr:endonuclease/exonuclease/phosphatase family protein [Saprospiraceae bacterium]MCF8250448.1 endonuclease/exonuclease/phosphatase family protein [Saprospiraceae bacterium]MCF8282111.1 endonuclease/exonuclease/phosphatase family protein [Bacteroidales bacterium]MCF8312406.1 endonuclease/exonuclease/phosphatase family protein [Saprospiraceae bacterium]MCF8440597.1 endonuclease/exonuclease/phosphatase family protein [Saprospiraceae bacterium]